MAGRTNMVILMLMVVASMQLQVSLAQTRHVVGGTTGWQVPSGGDATYSTWASSQTIVVGDTLVFNFPTGAHTVAEVTRAGFDACNGTSPISVAATGPATINLPTAGPRYFICTVGSHCSLGQRLSINVSAAATSSPPAAQPATPPSSAAAPVSPPTSTAAPLSPPASTPVPVPSPAQAPVTPPVATPTPTPTPTPAPAPSSRGPRTYVVGDSFGWNVPNSGGAATYRTWASDKTFVAGDILVFNFANQAHNVAEVTRAAFNSCNTTSTAIRVISTSPARITLTGGSHYYICTFPQHCSLGQQLAINVTSSATATPPTSTTTTPSAPSPDGIDAPPAPNSASSMAALPAALLSIALALLY